MNFRLFYPKIFLLGTGMFLHFYVAQQKKENSNLYSGQDKENISLSNKEFVTKNKKNKANSSIVNLPTVRREFRAAWVATVANINWPSRGNYDPENQRKEAIQLLDMLKKANFNAVIFQVRPSADALYKSQLEPWSYFLTGKIGQAPQPFYDPLEFWIEEAHKRGMELHVWLNPYRAHHTAGGPVTGESMVNKMGDKIVRLKNGMYWMDPADESVQNHTISVVKDIVKRYDIDAIHIDDYFYPYKEYNGGTDFPDAISWRKYQSSGGRLSRADWRRMNINNFVQRLHREIKEQKAYVKFGISPFGIWKPDYPTGIKGSSQYDELFADAKLWLNEGWCDYFSPQLYWKDGGAQSFSELLRWWQQENYKQIHLWPGLNTVGLKGVPDKNQEIAHQIELTRQITPKSPGAVHYSTDGLTKNATMLYKVSQKYMEDALVPKTTWIKTTELDMPNMEVERIGDSYISKWSSDKDAFRWVVYVQYGDEWTYQILDKGTLSQNFPIVRNNLPLKRIALQKVDRLSKESPVFIWTN